jgi:hypothetical protein
MQHLGVLEGADLVVVKRSGRNRWISQYARPSVELLTRLKRGLE